MRDFAHFLAIDWSGAKGERQKGIALALADFTGGPPKLLRSPSAWSRTEVLNFLLSEAKPASASRLSRSLCNSTRGSAFKAPARRNLVFLIAGWITILPRSFLLLLLIRHSVFVRLPEFLLNGFQLFLQAVGETFEMLICDLA